MLHEDSRKRERNGEKKHRCHRRFGRGIDALKSLVAELPAGLDASLFVVQHTSADSPVLLPAILEHGDFLAVIDTRRNGVLSRPEKVFEKTPHVDFQTRQIFRSQMRQRFNVSMPTGFGGDAEVMEKCRQLSIAGVGLIPERRQFTGFDILVTREDLPAPAGPAIHTHRLIARFVEQCEQTLA